MAKQDIKKQLDFLRALLYEGGGLDRIAMAERLHMSVSTYDKCLRDWRDRLCRAGLEDELTSVRHGYMRLRYRRQAAERTLILAYRLAATKEQQRRHLVDVLKALETFPGGATQNELLQALFTEQSGAGEYKDFSERTLKNILRSLEREGVVFYSADHGAKQFHLDTWLSDLVDPSCLTEEERGTLRDYIDYAAATEEQSVPGYWLLHTLDRYDGTDSLVESERLWYRHNAVGRMLDELWVMPLRQACREGWGVDLEYHPKLEDVHCRNHREKQTDFKQRSLFYPQQVVADKEFGRWYVLGVWEEDRPKTCSPLLVQVLRVENIAWIEKMVKTDSDKRWEAFVHKRLETAWLVEVRAEEVCVEAHFFAPDGPDYVGARLLREKRWGKVERTKDGWMLSLSVRGEREILPWLRSFGSHVEVLAPLALRNQLIADWKEAGRVYG